MERALLCAPPAPRLETCLSPDIPKKRPFQMFPKLLPKTPPEPAAELAPAKRHFVMPDPLCGNLPTTRQEIDQRFPTSIAYQVFQLLH